MTAPHQPKDEHYALRTHPLKGRGAIPLWIGFVGPALVWFLAFTVDYALVERACVSETPFVLHLVMVVFILLTAGCIWISWREWNRVGVAKPDEAGGATPRARFMAGSGMLTSSFFTLLLLAQWLPHFFLSPCNA